MNGKATRAIEAVMAAGLAFRVHEYRHDPGAQSYALEAADALGVDPDQVHKTLILQVDRLPQQRPDLVVALVPASTSCDLKAMARALGEKRVDLASPLDAQRSTGYVLGGISPLGQRQSLRTVIDEEAQLWDTIFVSAGRRGLEIELVPTELAVLLGATFAPIANR
jgi:Cys-tRNA(Pro)/Cys-tRNA(Cys) deacylase